MCIMYDRTRNVEKEGGSRSLAYPLYKYITMGGGPPQSLELVPRVERNSGDCYGFYIRACAYR
jgi:hypothetical protein